MPDLTIKGELPGESIVVALFDMIKSNRETMSQENRDRWDNAAFKVFKGWHNWWIELGWPGEKIE